MSDQKLFNAIRNAFRHQSSWQSVYGNRMTDCLWNAEHPDDPAPDTDDWFRVWMRPKDKIFCERDSPFVFFLDLNIRQYAGVVFNMEITPDGYWGNSIKVRYDQQNGVSISHSSGGHAGASYENSEHQFPKVVGIDSDIERARNFADAMRFAAYMGAMLEQIVNSQTDES
jgi:hypothetical protein